MMAVMLAVNEKSVQKFINNCSYKDLILDIVAFTYFGKGFPSHEKLRKKWIIAIKVDN